MWVELPQDHTQWLVLVSKFFYHILAALVIFIVAELQNKIDQVILPLRKSKDISADLESLRSLKMFK
jgi:hypothetical protein